MARAMDSGRVRRARMHVTSTVLLAAQLVTLGHLLIVRHSICPEHGEAIHSGLAGQARALAPAHQGRASDPVLVSETPTAEHAHDHCLARANTRERFALTPVLDSTPGSLPVVATLPLLSAVGAAPAVAVLRLAPKNSPPRA